MTPVEIIKKAMETDLRSEDGERIELKVQPGISAAEIEAFERTLPCPLPASIRQLLTFSRGFSDDDHDVRFTGDPNAFDYGEMFPDGLPIAMDGLGNSWLVDLNASSKEWAPIYFACHDPPVIQFQASSLEKFLGELFEEHMPPFESETTRVRDEGLFTIWRTNPGVIRSEQATGDAALTAFAAELGKGWEIVDLRNFKSGMGFSWGRYGPDTEVKRYGTESIFAYRPGPKRPGFISKLFGKKD